MVYCSMEGAPIKDNRRTRGEGCRECDDVQRKMGEIETEQVEERERCFKMLTFATSQFYGIYHTLGSEKAR